MIKRYPLFASYCVDDGEESNYDSNRSNVMYITSTEQNDFKSLVVGTFQYHLNGHVKRRHKADFMKIALLDAADDPDDQSDDYFVILEGIGVKFCPSGYYPDYYLFNDGETTTGQLS